MLSTIPSWPSTKLIAELRAVPHSCEYVMGTHNRARKLVFYGLRIGDRMLGLIDYTTSPARAYRVTADGQREEIL